ncbi:hypothetical protein [Tropicimonas sp. IMCC6043]|uniref:hypothetical protein n=1 Tax=Tropicimonas sp. IMCC6043 TaxID=2510645 RepID=UPI0013E9FE35|nr:hypothetical protein [Tropicimonas sp. IMCC6043]
MTDTSKTPDAAKKEPAPQAKPTDHEKVPAAAENMEHTLRRLTAEKEKRRQKNPGLYL